MPAKLTPLSAREEEQRSHFQSFYDRLPEKENIFYMFFTTGLLHWAIRTSRLASRAANVVLIGGGLSESEASWLDRHSGLPFHNVLGPADDKTIWELLARTNLHNFGWIDVDCFVLNPDLLVEMRRIDRDVFANCVWSYPYHDFYILTTYFIFLNIEAFRKVTAEVAVTPCTYSYETTRNSRAIPDATCRIMTEDLIERVSRVLPPEAEGPPRYPTPENFFDTLYVYQFVAQTMGYRLHRVRTLRLQNTDEIVHIGKVSYYTDGWGRRDHPETRQQYILLLQTELLMLRDLLDSLPPYYQLRWRKLSMALEKLGINPDPKLLEQNMRGVLPRMGLSPETFAQLIAS